MSLSGSAFTLACVQTSGFTALDFVVGLLLLVYTVMGFVRGFWVTLGGLLGVVGGAVGAYFAVPLVIGWVEDSAWRTPVTILTVVVLLGAGVAIGSAIGRALRKSTDKTPLKFLERLVGGVLGLVTSALVISMVAASISGLGVPWLTRALTDSRVISAIDMSTPAPVREWMAGARGAIVAQGIPTILGQVPPDQAVVPDAGVDTADYRRASASIVRVTGLAFQCGQNQSGSGFVVAPDRIVTNAHVIAGVSEPVVDIPGQSSRAGRVVYFDPANDIAVIAVEGLGLAPIPLAPGQDPGSTGAFGGYPAGGPYQIQPSKVISRSDVAVANIYGAEPSLRNVYTLAANVQQGNSGGPLLDAQGRVAGVIFAKAVQSEPVGYALSQSILEPVAAGAPGMNEQVQTGVCTVK